MRNKNEATGSDYMHWAKTRSSARFNLATSGLRNLSMRDLEASLADIEINGPVGYGFPPLREALAARYRVEPDNVVAATGTSLANHLAMAALIEAGDEVLIERPAYEPLLALAHYLKADIKRFDRRFDDGFSVSTEEVKRHLTSRTRLVVITNLHNPSGVLTEERTLKQLGELAASTGARVLVDEVYLEALFEPQPRTALHLGNEFVVTNSLTKVFGLSGLRCGWILADPELAKRIWRLNDLFGVNAAHPAERLGKIALRQIDRLAAIAKSLLDTNHAIVNDFLDSRPDLEIVRPGWGTVLFPRLRSGNADRLCELLRDNYETSVVPGRFFELPEHFRLGIGCDSEQLSDGLERLGLSLNELAGG